jgi:PIN domain nuclease of toxin-antitoxin system
MGRRLIVLDASALLAVFRNERGADIVTAALSESEMSSINVAEVLSKIVERGGDGKAALRDIRAMGIEIIPYDEQQALKTAELRRVTSPKGLSLGDRACLALAASRNCAAMTAERQWKGLAHGVQIALVR